MKRLTKFMVVLFIFLCACDNKEEKTFNLVKTTIDGTEYGNSIIDGYIEFSNENMSDGIIYITCNNEVFIDWIISEGTFTDETVKGDTYKYANYSCIITSSDDESLKGVLVGIYQKVGKDDSATEIFGLGIIDSDPNTYFTFSKISDS